MYITASNAYNDLGIGPRPHPAGIVMGQEGSYLGSGTQFRRRFFIDSTYKMYMYSPTGVQITKWENNGNFLVGSSTTTPAYKLSVLDNGVNTSGNFYTVAGIQDETGAKGINLGYNNSDNSGIIATNGNRDIAFWRYNGSAWSESTRFAATSGNWTLNTGNLTLTAGNLTSNAITGTTINGTTITGTRSIIGSTSSTLPAVIETSSSSDGLLKLRNTAANGYTSFEFYGDDGNQKAAFGFGNSSAISFLAGRSYIGIPNAPLVITRDNSTASIFVSNTARAVGIGNITSPTARLHLEAGTATASTAPLKLTTGTLLTTPETGAIEFASSRLTFTPTSTRHDVLLIPSTEQPSVAAGTKANVLYTGNGSANAATYSYFQSGVFSGTTDSNGDIQLLFPSALPDVTYSILVTVAGTTLYSCTAHTKATGGVYIRCFNSSGTVLGAGINIDLNYEARDY